MQSLFAKASLRSALGNSRSKSASVMASIGSRSFYTKSLNFPISQASASFETGTNSVYFEQMHEQWKADPSSVHSSWRTYFEGIEKGIDNPFVPPPTLGQTAKDAELRALAAALQSGNVNVQSASSSRDVADSSKVMQLIQGYQTTGHVLARLDPLKLSETYSQYSNLARIYKKHT